MDEWPILVRVSEIKGQNTVSETNTIPAGKDSNIVLDYFARNGAPCPHDTNPAEHIVEIIQSNTEVKIDWVDIWSQSPERRTAINKLMLLNEESAAADHQIEEGVDFASSKWFQFKMVLYRLMIQLWRSPVSSIAQRC